MNQDISKVCQWIRTEIIAGMVLIPKSEADRVWNDASLRAAGIVSNYAAGNGLFQVCDAPKIPDAITVEAV